MINEAEDRNEVAIGSIGPSKEEGKVETLSHTYHSLLLGAKQEVIPEEERDEEDYQKTQGIARAR